MQAGICSRLLNLTRFWLNSYSSSLISTNKKSNSSGISDSPINIVQKSSFNKPCLNLISGVSGISKDDSTSESTFCQFGDDAWFSVHNPECDVIGVADGVGGWREYGVDPGQFSRSLMASCSRLISARSLDICVTSSPHTQLPASQVVDPSRLLGAAFTELVSSRQPVVGSTTACVLVLARHTHQLHTANIGDSGYMVVRAGRVVARSTEQQHYFNTPYQLCNAPPECRGQVLCDSPDTAITTTHSVCDGDIVLLGTDGLFDNLPETYLLEHISPLSGCRDEARLQKAANTLVMMARSLALDTKFMSPFARSARQYGISATGGKPDDITVVLAAVYSPDVAN